MTSNSPEDTNCPTLARRNAEREPAGSHPAQGLSRRRKGDLGLGETPSEQAEYLAQGLTKGGKESRYSNSPEDTGLSNIGSEKRQARTGWKPPRPRSDEGREGRNTYSNSPEGAGLSNIGSEERRAITGWNPPRPRSDEGREGRNTCSNSPESAGLSKNRPLQKRDRGDRETELAFFEEMLRSSQISSSSVRSSDTKRDEFPLRSAEIPIEERCSSSVNTQKGAVGATKDISPSRATESPSDMINTNQSKENHSQKSSHEGRKASQEGSLKTSTELCAQSKCLAERIEESDGKISKSVVEAPSPEKISMNRSTEISDSAIKSPSGTLNPFLRAESTRISADGLLLRGKGLQQRGTTSLTVPTGDTESINQTHEVWCRSRQILPDSFFNTGPSAFRYPCAEMMLGVNKNNFLLQRYDYSSPILFNRFIYPQNYTPVSGYFYIFLCEEP
ncbi:Hypothetical predicted protein [Cloeon dipterum]|uniref:Uncharacterized protein n=1 Tax=Cloeon dipterum TaxID=197152 RepID=A0A8S1CQU7_9INSE|nr:Hypothetical predicted protein [Cloeon dipterum]